MMDDAELLRRFAKNRDEPAFAELVRRHVDLVHSAALRQLNGDAHLAQDATQLVFADLARKAGGLAGERVLAGWLFVSTRYAASKLVRGERRRQVREQEAHLMQELSHDSVAQLDWDKVRPVLDAALGELSEGDRCAVLLRFFEGRAFAEVGSRLRVNENTARMKVERALDKLHAVLTRRGLTSTTAALAAALANQAVVAAPAGLAVSVTGTVLSGVAAGVGSGGVGLFMTFTKLQIGCAGAIAVAAVTGYTVQQRDAALLRNEIASVQSQIVAGPALGSNSPAANSHQPTVAAAQTDAELARLSEEAADLKADLIASSPTKPASRPSSAPTWSPKPFANEAGSLDRAPVASRRVPPQYPAEMRKAGVTGRVVVEFVVDAEGKVHQATAVESSRPEFEAAAVKAVSQWVYQPGQKGGRTVNAKIQQAIEFTIGGDVTVTPSNWF